MREQVDLGQNPEECVGTDSENGQEARGDPGECRVPESKGQEHFRKKGRSAVSKCY